MFSGQVIPRERGQPGHPWLVRIHAGLDEERGDSMEDEGVYPRGSDRVSHREVSSLLICGLPTSNKRSALIS